MRASSRPSCRRRSSTTTASAGSRCSPGATVTGIERTARARVTLGDGRDARGGRGRGRARHRAERRARGGTPACRSRTASSSTRSAASAVARTCSPPATSLASRSPALGGEMRVEHEDHAKSHGRRVGANMAGAARAVRPPAVLLLRPLRPRLRGGRRARLAARDVRRAGASRDRGSRLLPRRRARPRGVLLWEPVRPRRRAARVDPRREPDPSRACSSPDRSRARSRGPAAVST